jgi:hypothetical protein
MKSSSYGILRELPICTYTELFAALTGITSRRVSRMR